jgi:RNA polymerase primary sigma factor
MSETTEISNLSPQEAAKAIKKAVEALLGKGGERGYVTWEEMNKILPDEAIDPNELEKIMMRLEEGGVETLDELDAVAYEARRKSGRRKRGRKEGEAPGEPPEAVHPPMDVSPLEVVAKRIDDPVRMYLTQMGEIPLLKREEEIRLAKKIELTRMAFRQKVLESDYCAGLAVKLLQQVHDGRLPFDRTMKISTSEHAASSKRTFAADGERSPSCSKSCHSARAAFSP